MKLAFALLFAAGCGSGSVAADAPDAPPDVPIDGLPGFAVHGTIYEWTSPTTHGAALAGARICLYQHAHCVNADASGAYTLDGIPNGSDFAIAVDTPGYLRTMLLLPAPSPSFPQVNLSLVTVAVAQQKVTVAGGTWPLINTGIIEAGAVIASGTAYVPAPGATYTMTPASGTGPVYLGTDGYPSPSLTETSAEGGAMFVNVAAGEVVVGYTLAGKSCVSSFDGWHGTTAGTVRMPAEAATLTYIAALCQ